jgi:hypothetical protein
MSTVKFGPGVVLGPIPLSAPFIGTATTASSFSINVPFTQPIYNGGIPIIKYIATSNPGSITSTLTQSGSGTITVSGLTPEQFYTFTVTAYNAFGPSPSSCASNSIAPPPIVGSQLFTTAGNYTFLVPQFVTHVSVVAVGGGGGGVACVTYKSVATNGGDSYFSSTSTVKGGGGLSGNNCHMYDSGNAYYYIPGGTHIGDGGGDGGRASFGNGFFAKGAGGAGGYSGNGGNGNYTQPSNYSRAPNGAGGGGGGGMHLGGGGGVGVFGAICLQYCCSKGGLYASQSSPIFQILWQGGGGGSQGGQGGSSQVLTNHGYYVPGAGTGGCRANGGGCGGSGLTGQAIPGSTLNGGGNGGRGPLACGEGFVGCSIAICKSAGGGGGAFGGGGGGGMYSSNPCSAWPGSGGGLGYKNNILVTTSSYTVVVGAGGAGAGHLVSGGTNVPSGGSGGAGAVRIVWPGSFRKFPSTCVGTP